MLNIFQSLLQKVWLQLAVRTLYNANFFWLAKKRTCFHGRVPKNYTHHWFETCEVTLWLKRTCFHGCVPKNYTHHWFETCEVTLWLSHQLTLWFWPITIYVFLTFITQSCYVISVPRKFNQLSPLYNAESNYECLSLFFFAT